MSKEKTLRTLEETEVMQATGVPAQETEEVSTALATEIIADLKKQLEEAKEEAKEWEESWNMCREQVRALSRQSDKAIASSTVSSAIDNVLKRLRQQDIEIERFTHHAFRDTFATRYIEEGGNMQTLQKILGHSSLAMTADLYAHVLPNTKQQEMQQIENGFIGVAVL